MIKNNANGSIWFWVSVGIACVGILYYSLSQNDNRLLILLGSILPFLIILIKERLFNNV